VPLRKTIPTPQALQVLVPSTGSHRVQPAPTGKVALQQTLLRHVPLLQTAPELHEAPAGSAVVAATHRPPLRT